MSEERFTLDGAELLIRADAGKVVIRVYMTGGLAGLSRSIIVPAELAELLGDEIMAKARQARELAP